MTAISPALSTSAATTVQSQKPTVLTSDFETFLKMLTAQARYQDPLEPIDSTEYAAQLAQFSMVEQQVLTNSTLSEVLGASNLAALSGWIGREVRADMPADFDGAPITVSVEPAFGADAAILVVTDATGKEVQRASIAPEFGPIEWAGVSDDGAPLPAGLYSFALESYRGDELIQSQSAQVYARVVEAQVVNGETMLILPGDLAIPASFATALRDAAA